MATVERLLRPQKGAGSLNPGVAQTVLQSDRYKPAWRGWWVLPCHLVGSCFSRVLCRRHAVKFLARVRVNNNFSPLESQTFSLDGTFPRSRYNEAPAWSGVGMVLVCVRLFCA